MEPRPPRHVRLSSVCSAPASDHTSHGVGGSSVAPSCSTLASGGVVLGPTRPSHHGTSRAPKSMEPPRPASRPKVPSRPRDPRAPLVEFIQRLVRKAGFSRKVASVMAADLQRSTTALYQSKWSQFLDWCGRRDVNPCATSISVIAESCLHLCQDLGFSVTAVKGYRSALNHVFALTGMDLVASKVVSRMFCHFERTCPPREIRPPDWNFSLVLLCLSRPPFEPLKLTSDKHLTWKKSFLLALVSAKRVSELHGLSFRICHSCGWRSCTFSFLLGFIAKTQNPSVPDSRFEEFTIPSLDDFVGGDRDELLCPICALRKYLSWTEHFRPGIESLFVSTGHIKKRVLRNKTLYPVISWLILLPLKRIVMC